MSDNERFKERFDGKAAWGDLTDEQQAEIGAIALELVVAWNGQDAYEEAEKRRPFKEAEGLLLDALHRAVEDTIPQVIAAEPLPFPSHLGPVCRRCGVSDLPDPNDWAEDDLCGVCTAVSR